MAISFARRNLGRKLLLVGVLSILIAVLAVGVLMRGRSGSVAASGPANGYLLFERYQADGDVTTGEFDEATRITLECMRAAGAEIFDLQRDNRGALEFVYAAPKAPDPATAVEEARECEDEIRRPVQTAWGLQRAAKGEERERIREWLASTGGTPPAISAAGLDECLRDNGAIAENETIDDLAERMQDEGRMLYPPAVHACLDDVTGKAYRSE